MRRIISALLKRNRSLMDGFIMFRRVNNGRDKILKLMFDRVVDAREEELEKAQEEIKRVEEALRVKTTQWQELHKTVQNFQQNQQSGPPQLQESEKNDPSLRLKEAEETIKGQRVMMLKVQEQLVIQKSYSSALKHKLEKLEKKLGGKLASESAREARRHRLTEKVRISAEVYGVESRDYKTKRKLLDKHLQEEADDFL